MSAIGRALGVFFISLPFVAFTAMMVASGGVAFALAIYGAVATVFACLWTGIYLLSRE